MHAVSPKLDCPHLQAFGEANCEVDDEGFSILPENIRSKLQEISSENTSQQFQGKCRECEQTEENWLCLTCSDLFCSRYVQAHMVAHNKTTGHECALSLSDASFWCYSCDNGTYVYSDKIRKLASEIGAIKHLDERALADMKLAHSAAESNPCCVFKLPPLAEEEGEEGEEGEKKEEACDLQRAEEEKDETLPTATEEKKLPATEEKEEEEEKKKKLLPKEESVGIPTLATSTIPTPRTLAVYYHSKCEEHEIAEHPEQPNRVRFILRALQQAFPSASYRLATPCTNEHLVAFHTPALIERFNNCANKVEAPDFKTKSDVPYVSIDGDTKVMNKTRHAAYYAAGSVILAIDHMFGLPDDDPLKITTAFCCVRPPGHHAETNLSMGFCFFNNAGVGAKYAQQKYGKRKVAVLDFDVHHGNGTEEGFLRDPTLFYGSTHEKDNYPGTGKDPSPFVGDNARIETNRRIVNRTLSTGPATRKEFRWKWLQILSEMERFAPDLVIISAGFDAHIDDPLATCEFADEDFEWATDVILESCARIRPEDPIPVMSVLEGGYNLKAISRSAVCHVRSLLAGFPRADRVDKDRKEEEEGYGGDEVRALAAYLKQCGLDGTDAK